jgi:hypothetical protein
MLSIQKGAINWARRLCLMTCAAWFLSAQVFAGSPTNQMDRCQAPDPQQNQKTTTEKKSDTEMLADCNGVLKPPSTGDSNFVIPAPPVGDTPVIPPGAAPQKQQ